MEEQYIKNWFVLFVMGGQEKTICDHLNKYTMWQAFIPMREVIHKKQGKMFTMLKPLLPSYLFIETELSPKDFRIQFRKVRMRISGIIKELHYEDNTPALLPEEQKYLEVLLNDDFVLRKSIGFIENDRVVITNGPLKGYESRIIKIDRHKKQAVIELEVLKQTLCVTVSLEIVSKI